MLLPSSHSQLLLFQFYLFSTGTKKHRALHPVPPPADVPIPPKKLIQPEKPKSPFGQKQGTTDEKPRDWDESQWIE